MTMLTPKLVLLLLGAVTFSTASPARMFFGSGHRRNSAFNDAVVTVDCSNREAVRFVSKTHPNFRCVYPNQSPRGLVVSDSASSPVLFSHSVGNCRPGQVYDQNRRICTPTSYSSNLPVGLQSASLIRDDPNSCPPGKIFVSEIGVCLFARKPTHTAPLQSDNLVVEEPRLEITAFSSNIQFPSDCKSNEIYNSELSICFPYNSGKAVQPLSTGNLVRAPLAPLEIHSFSSSIQTASDCKDDEFYVSEINTCVSINPIAPLQSASLVRESYFADHKVITPKDCLAGEVYVSEIGICLPANPPRIKKPIVAGSLIKDKAPAVPVHDKVTCNTGEIFVPEIGICMPARPFNNNPTVPASSSLVKEPVKLEIKAFETSKSLLDCPPGSIFVSEIGICM